MMNILVIKGKSKRQKYRTYQGEIGRIADNLLKRNFTASRPNEKWVFIITTMRVFGVN